MPVETGKAGTPCGGNEQAGQLWQRNNAMPHILLVEDDPFTVGRLRRLLVLSGVCRVMHAATVAKALERRPGVSLSESGLHRTFPSI